ncbi:uncharacterized protein TNCV_2055961 [Trichonephila clavipes]|nr:uncharacterized protein TNCV_2055961 [Trichonephila clavipes]
MNYDRKWCTHDFLAESQKLLEKAPTSKDAGLTLPADGKLNIGKYLGHLPDFACYDSNPRNQGLVRVGGACYATSAHKGRSVEEYLESEDIRRNARPVSSSDLNPLEQASAKYGT